MSQDRNQSLGGDKTPLPPSGYPADATFATKNTALNAVAMERLAKRYAVLELAQTFGEAVDQYLALQDANQEMGRETELLPTLAPLVADFPSNLPKAIARAASM